MSSPSVVLAQYGSHLVCVCGDIRSYASTEVILWRNFVVWLVEDRIAPGGCLVLFLNYAALGRSPRHQPLSRQEQPIEPFRGVAVDPSADLEFGYFYQMINKCIGERPMTTNSMTRKGWLTTADSPDYVSLSPRNSYSATVRARATVSTEPNRT